MTEKNMWNLSPQEALKACQASEQGLTTEQAEKIRLEKGENVLLEEKKKSAFRRRRLSGDWSDRYGGGCEYQYHYG